jgi:hypothetical protein
MIIAVPDTLFGLCVGEIFYCGGAKADFEARPTGEGVGGNRESFRIFSNFAHASRPPPGTRSRSPHHARSLEMPPFFFIYHIRFECIQNRDQNVISCQILDQIFPALHRRCSSHMCVPYPGKVAISTLPRYDNPPRPDSGRDTVGHSRSGLFRLSSAPTNSPLDWGVFP